MSTSNFFKVIMSRALQCVSGALKLGNKVQDGGNSFVAEFQRSGHTLEGSDIMHSTIVDVNKPNVLKQKQSNNHENSQIITETIKRSKH